MEGKYTPGKCSVCDKAVFVSPDGAVVVHTVKLDNRPVPCSGVGQAPAPRMYAQAAC